MSLSPAPDPDPTTQMTWLTSTSSDEVDANGPSNGEAAEPSQQDRYRNETRPDPKAQAGARASSRSREQPESANRDIGTARLSSLQLFKLSVSMAGAQVAWTVELGWASSHSSGLLHLSKHRLTHRYGTPFLLSLGLSEQVTSLVWLAGPISGLIAQPLIGTLFQRTCVACSDA